MDWDARRLSRYLTLRDLNVLMTVVQSGSMGKAAIRLAVSQPAVSKAIADMEQALGVRLLDRNKQGVKPTVFADALLDHGSVVFDELQQGLRKIETLADPTRGEIRIACSALLAEGFVASVIGRFARRYPKVTFRLVAEESGASYAALVQRKVDLAILRIFEPAPQSELATEILYDEPHVVAVGARSPWVKRRPIKLANLMNASWALPPLDSLTGSIVRESFGAAGLEVPPATIITSSTPARYALVASGQFVSVLPASLWAYANRKPAVKALPIKLAVSRRPIGIVTLRKRALTPVARLFIECAREVAKSVATRRS